MHFRSRDKNLVPAREHTELRLIYALGNMHHKEALIVMGKSMAARHRVQAYDLSKKSAMKWFAPLERDGNQEQVDLKAGSVLNPFTCKAQTPLGPLITRLHIHVLRIQ